MTLTDSIDAVLIDRSAHLVFPESFIWILGCACTMHVEPEECDHGHLVCGNCGTHLVERRLG